MFFFVRRRPATPRPDSRKCGRDARAPRKNDRDCRSTLKAGKNDRDCRGTLKAASERRSVASLARLSLEFDLVNYELLLALLDASRFNSGLPTDRCSVDDTSFIASSTLLAEEDDEAEVVADCDLLEPNMACKN